MDLVPIEVDRLDADYSRTLSEHLERGNILLLNPTPFLPSEEDCEFLRTQKQAGTGTHKNIAYKPHLNKITGADADAANAERMRSILARYSEGALECLARIFPDYARQWKVDYASFRPVEEQGRDLPIKHRNDLMHLDAFPTRPTHGGRILRAFTNLHQTRDRVWGTSEPFEDLARKYANSAGLGRVTSPIAETRRRAARLGRLIGIRVPERSAYDEFMLHFHHYLKTNEDFQRTGQTQTAAFPPGATWITFTDQVAHKAASGQYAIEQTCIVPFSAMLHPELAPVAVLERIAGKKLVSPQSAGEQAADQRTRAHA